ncbi:MAG: MFS transporter [Phycicoccus sp.]|nr:MFS transporter [Phycicoccus sp.]NMM33825.1 MFS transporter [Phycicoccus sp.]
MSPTFASLSIYNYRLFAAGALVSNTGTWMGRVAQDWLVLTVLAPHTSVAPPVALGIVTGLQFAPLALFAPFGGMIADRFPKRRILFSTQSAMALTSLLTGILVVTGAVQLWHIYLLAFVQGVATALDNPARQTFVSEMVPHDSLSNAVGLNSASFNGARLIGPGLAGLVIAAFDTGPAFFLNALSFAAVLFALARMRTGELNISPRQRGKGQIREGLRYVRSRPDIILIMALVFVLGTFGMNFQMTTALMATAVFGKGAGGYGLLGSIMAVGSLSAALLSARRPNPRLRVLLVAYGAFAVASAAAALAPSYVWFAVLLIPVGLTALTVITTATAMVQLSVAPAMRGRVMALYLAVFMGGTPLGSPLIGWIGSAWGPRWTILVGSITTGMAVLAAMLYLVRSENVRVTFHRHERPRLRVTRGDIIEPAPEMTS